MRQRSDDDQRQALGAAIRARRKRLGLTRRDLERESEISYPYLSEIEAGKKNPSNSILQRIGEALQSSPSELMAAAEQTMAQPAPAPVAAMLSPALPSKAYPPKGFFHEATIVDQRSDPAEEDPLIELLRIAKGLPPEELGLLLDVARRFDA